MAIDALWDFDDPAASESRFRDRLANAQGGERLEVLTQIARALGLQGHFDDAHRTLDEVESALPSAGQRVHVRYLLERGRALRSGGRSPEAIPLFTSAVEHAIAAGEDSLAIDAMHMVAITASDPAEQMRWHERGIAAAEASADTANRKWLATLRNNLGWALFDAGRLAEALDQFERAADERRLGKDVKRRKMAEWSVARALRALGRIDEALAIQRALAAEWDEKGMWRGFIEEELAECLLALGHDDEARPHFAAAHAALLAHRAIAASEPERLERLRQLSGAEAQRPGKVL